MINKDMANTRNKESTSGDCGQEARILLEELNRIVYGRILRGCVDEISLKDVYEEGSKLLKIFMVKNIRKEEKVESMKKILEDLVRIENDKEMRIRIIEKVTMDVMEEMRIAEIDKRRNEYRKKPRCYNCAKIGHKSIDCYYKYRGRENKLECNRIKEEDTNNSSCSSEEDFRNTHENKRQKKNILGIGVRRKVIDEGYIDRMSIDVLRKKFKRVFCDGTEVIEYCKLEKCKINTKEGEIIVKKGQCIPQALMKDTENFINSLEKRKIIRRSSSKWRNPIRALRKPDGGIRLVSNLMALNDLVEKDAYELANIRDIIRFTQGSKYFTVIDLKEGFYSIEIEETDKHKTAFEFNRKVYEWNSMVMGYKNSPQILQRIMNTVFEEYLGRGIEVYMDDIVIHGKTKDEHDKLVILAIKRLEENKMKVNIGKVQLCQREIKLLGVTLNGQDITPSEIKKNEALEFPVPNNVSDVRRFLGLTGWFRSFIMDYAGLTIHLTDCLKGKNKEWKWTEMMEQEFIKLKETVKSLGKLRIADYEKEFLLRTDASNVGMGAVLMQRNEKNEWVPVQWASKKFTPTEGRYGISEKEMYAIFWGIKKFEYELRGRKFKIETDHKALIEIRRKPHFKNDRINRWVEKIQEFDFTIEYKQPETMVVADALSRIYTEENPKKLMIKNRTEKQVEGKLKKHLVKEGDKEFWVFDNGERAEVPKEEIRREMIMMFHDDLGHRSVGSVHYAMKKKYYWPGMKSDIYDTILSCERCQIYNRKKSGGCDFVSTSRYLEKVALDLIDFRDLGMYVLVGIDYHTRLVWGITMKEKKGSNVTWFIESLCRNGNRPEEIITDNGKEFINEGFKELCHKLGIRHRKVSIESHRSNGRVERVIGTLREAILKMKEMSFEEKVHKSIENYNNSFHSGIGCTPTEATKDNTGKVMIENGPEGDYSKKFIRRKRELFFSGQIVRIAKKENLKGTDKYEKGRFLKKGKIFACCGGDSYLVKLMDGRLVKKRHYDLKGLYGDRRFRYEKK